MNRIDYSKVDLWIKKHPQGEFQDFLAENPQVSMSIWTFKRRLKVLGLPGARKYRPRKKDGEGICLDRRSRTAYTTVFTIPVSDLKKKNGVEAASEIIGALNRVFKLGLESAQVEIIGSGLPNFEIRKYSR
jgi:hypothetical protein